jgi:hypothetical protein
MGFTADEDWPEGFMIAVPHAWRDDGLWPDMQAAAQERIGTRLREIYAELLQQPLSPSLSGLVQEIATRLEPPRLHG